MTFSSPKNIRLLIIEDNPGDIRLFQEVFKENKLQYQLDVVSSEEEGLNFLFRQKKYSSACRPHLILLDWNLPKKGEDHFLTKIKSDPYLKSIPVIIFTSSNSEKDISAAYRLHANCYLNKPMNLEDYIDVIKLIDQFWLKTVALPFRE